MKTILISLLVLISSTVKAEGIRYDGNGAPIFAKLKVAGITRNMTLINPRFNSIISGSVVFNEKNLSLTLNRAMPRCAQGMMCIQVMPAPLNIKLDIVKIEKNDCSVVYTAATPANVKSTVHEVVTVEDFTNTNCPALVDSVGSITYQATGISNLSKQQETATANFLVDGSFIRAQN